MEFNISDWERVIDIAFLDYSERLKMEFEAVGDREPRPFFLKAKGAKEFIGHLKEFLDSRTLN